MPPRPGLTGWAQVNGNTLLTNDEIATSRIPNYVFSKAFLEEQSR